MWDKIDWTIWIVFYALFVLLIALTVSGCSAFGIEFGTHRTVAIEKSPYRIVISGDIQEKDKPFVKDMLLFLEQQKYRDHNFTAIKVQVTGAETTIHNVSQPKNKEQDSSEE